MPEINSMSKILQNKSTRKSTSPFGGQWRVFVFKQLISYLFLLAKAKGGAEGGGRRVALLEVVGVEVGLLAEPVHESGGPGGGT